MDISWELAFLQYGGPSAKRSVAAARLIGHSVLRVLHIIPHIN